jgi:GR25 family glycosyltransferase involved in LPS biosynthesis
MSDKVKKFFGDIPVYIINLTDCIERRERINKQFSGYEGLKIVDAIDGRNSDSFNTEYNVIYFSDLNYTTALIACLCSHIKVIKQAYDNGDKYSCVFEDDVNLSLLELTNHSLAEIININDDWELIQLYYSNNLQNHCDDYLHNGIKLIKSDGIYSGSCYIINRIGMENILTNIVETDGQKIFHIKKKILYPEHILLGYANSYIVNIPFFYFDTYDVTFNEYIYNDSINKMKCQEIHQNTKSILLYYHNLINNRL